MRQMKIQAQDLTDFLNTEDIKAHLGIDYKDEIDIEINGLAIIEVI